MTRIRVAILGHSYVRRQGEYVAHTKSFKNLRLSERLVVKFYGRGGSTTCGPERFFARDADYHPARKMDLTRIHLGENHYGTGAHPDMVADELVKSARCLVEKHEVKKVMISELLPFSRCNNRQWVRQVNKRLSQLVTGTDTILLWGQKRAFWSKYPGMLYWDGIHVRN